VTPDQTLYRGCLLRKVSWVVGIVIFTGAETKIMMNARKPPHKASRVEKLVNKLLIFVLLVQLVLCIAGAVGLYLSDADSWYLGPVDGRSAAKEAGLGFLTFIILFNNFIPISLYVSIEFVKFFQGRLLEQDLVMYYDPKDMRANAKTTDLNEELGQINYVFSDKTGTLTRNVMTFMKFCLPNGDVYGEGTTEIGRAAAKRFGREVVDGRPHEVIHSDNPFWDTRANDSRWLSLECADEIRRLFSLLAVCHTVVVDGGKYEAESPDEEALVKAAALFGYTFVNRQTNRIMLEVGLGAHQEYNVLDIIEFTSDRKRMSLLVRCPDGEVRLMMKGADSHVFPRLVPGFDVRKTNAALGQFGDEGLRTLVLAERIISEKEWKPWLAKNQMSKGIIGDDKRKAAELEANAAEIERDMVLVGSTAIEDKLQEGVPQTIEALRTAGMKVWMLTGDKMETAINIGFACALLHEKMRTLNLNVQIKRDMLIDAMEYPPLAPDEEMGVIVDGDTLAIVFNDDAIKARFIEVTAQCTSVVCCRVSPKQKADVVEMVRANKPDAVTLSIGDGANDVPMIQAAHVGVGISGMEGQQAANSADYAIGQFRYLHRLTLVHGRANYYRLCLLIRYFFYKNALCVMTQFWFCIFNLFTGQNLFENWTLAMYNVFFTFLPVIVVGILERPVLNTDNVHDYPKLYAPGLNDELLNLRVFVLWMFNAIYHSAIIFFVVMFGWYYGIGRNGIVLSLDGVGVVIYATIIVVVNLKLALHCSSFTWLHYLSFGASVLGFFLFLAVYGVFPATFNTLAYHQLENIGFQLSPWFFFFIATILCLARDFLWRYAEYNFRSIANLPTLLKVQMKDDKDPKAAIRMPAELRKSEANRLMKEAHGDAAGLANLFADFDSDIVVIDPAQDLFMQFVDREIEDEFIDQHMGNLNRYKIGVGMCAIASVLLVINFSLSYPDSSTELEIGTWALFSVSCWICFAILMCSSLEIKQHLHTIMTSLMIIGFSGMTIANLVRAGIDEDTHPVTLGVILLGMLTVVRPPLVHALHYIIISFLCYIVWYQAFRVTAWKISDFMLRFLELVVVAVTAFTSLAVSESFLRRMFISQKQVEATSEAAAAEERRGLVLLGNVLPSAVVHDLRANKARQLSDFSVTYKRASLLNSDIVKFTIFSSTKEPHVVVEMLNKMFTKFDSRAKELGLEKIKTIGDAYICAAGIPIPDPHHQKKILLMGLAMVHCIQELNAEGLTSLPELNIQIRIGTATGPVQAGVIGMEKVCYDVFGHVAEESEHMEQSGLADRVQASPALREATRDMFDFDEIVGANGVKQYFVVMPEHLVLQTPRSSDGKVLVNDLHREDIYKFLEDTDMERREIIRRYAEFGGEMSTLTLNFIGSDNCENEFRHHLRTIANTRFTVEGALGTFIFIASFVLIYLDSNETKTNIIVIICLILGLLHFIATIVRLITRRRKQRLHQEALEKAEAESRLAPEESGRIGTPANQPIVSIGGHDDADVDEDPNSCCTLLRAWAFFSGLCAYALPLVLMLLVLWSKPTSSVTISVFIILAANIYVQSFMHIRLWPKLIISVLHAAAVLASYWYLLDKGDDRGLDSGRDSGNVLAIILCYILCVVGTYMIERSVRQSFAAARRVVFQNAEVMAAIDLCDKLLNNVLPRSIVRRLKQNPDKPIVDEVPEASVMFVYTAGLRADSVEGVKATGDIVAEMNEYLWLMDSLCLHHKVEKIKTTPFLIVSGCPELVTDHARRLVLLARDILHATEVYNHRVGADIHVKVGIHTGKVTAGVLGSTKFLYDIFGDTVNLASRLTSSATYGSIQISEVTKRMLSGEFTATSRGVIELKGKGNTNVFMVDLEDPRLKAIPVPDITAPTRATRDSAEVRIGADSCRSRRRGGCRRISSSPFSPCPITLQKTRHGSLWLARRRRRPTGARRRRLGRPCRGRDRRRRRRSTATWGRRARCCTSDLLTARGCAFPNLTYPM
jgi:phospholipid-transporting ATPase